MNRPPIQAKMSDRWPKWEAKTRAILVETAIPTAPMTVGVIHPILEAATLPIRGQEEKSAFGAMNGWCDAMPYVAGNYGDRYSVRSRFRRSQSSCSTHMYNCRRARFGAPAWAILQWSLRPCFEVVSWWSFRRLSEQGLGAPVN